jgi:hypothetical protein
MKEIGHTLQQWFLLVAAGLALVCLAPGRAAALTVTPITWDVIGLDSNVPAFGGAADGVELRIRFANGQPGRRKE